MNEDFLCFALLGLDKTRQSSGNGKTLYELSKPSSVHFIGLALLDQSIASAGDPFRKIFDHDFEMKIIVISSISVEFLRPTKMSISAIQKLPLDI